MAEKWGGAWDVRAGSAGLQFASSWGPYAAALFDPFTLSSLGFPECLSLRTERIVQSNLSFWLRIRQGIP